MLLLLGIAIPSSAQDGPAQLQPIRPDIVEAEPAVQAAAEAMFRQAGETMKSAPAMTCRSTVKVMAGPEPRTVVVESKFGEDGSMQVEGLESLIVVKDGYINIVLFSVHDRFIRVPRSMQPSDNILTLFNERSLAGYEMLMREGQPPEVWLEPLMMRSVGKPKVTGLESVTTEDGTQLQRILVAGHLGSGSIDFDPEKKIIVAARSKMYPLTGAEDFSWEMTLEPKMAFLEKLPEPITFDPGRRIPVTTRSALDPVARNRLAVGDPAPVLRLPLLDGTILDLAEMRGKMVVLDFWATWCGPCKRSLPEFNQLYIEQGRNEKNVLVYAVDVMERASKMEERLEIVSTFWREQKYEVPTMVAPNDAVTKAWGISSIPYTVVIGPDGRIMEILVGYSPNSKARIDSALKKDKKGRS